MLKDARPEVRLLVVPGHPINWDQFPQLDPSNPDDFLVVQAISFGCGASVFSHDSAPRIRARIAGITAHEPEESWLLPPEQTDDQRIIAKLKRELDAARSTVPTITLSFPQSDGDNASLQCCVLRLAPMEKDAALAAAEGYLTANAPFRFPGSSHFIYGYSESTIADYQAAYNRFKNATYSFFENLHQGVNRVTLAAAIRYRLCNSEGASARELRVDFRVEGEASLLVSREDALDRRHTLNLPKPPDNPRGILDSFAGPSALQSVFLQDLKGRNEHPRDPLIMYWIDRPKPGAQQGSQHCSEFRPTKTYDGTIYVLPRKLPFVGSVAFEIGASNLPQPICRRLDVQIEEKCGTWTDNVVLDLLPSQLTTYLCPRRS